MEIVVNIFLLFNIYTWYNMRNSGFFDVIFMINNKYYQYEYLYDSREQIRWVQQQK
ncbi:hypothetical protein MPAN_000640 [Mariniplasma anaerobium]|uniref:Uncharacterized protein n=1 Tax=Mariniplasma anaerobium TaxID=2735436 RepID=A0A7U9TJ62_9MOLU|nr:hypothetical protein MPAN_000640 [Mariniplasma anaerobium]